MADEMPPPGMVETKTVANMANVVEPDSVGRFYANHAQVNISLFEIRLAMNFVTGVNSENGHLHALEQMIIAMSPELANALHGMLGRALDGYKRDYGNLRGPVDPKIKHVPAETSVMKALDMADELSTDPTERKRD